MKSLKARFVVAAAVLAVVLGVFVVAINVNCRDTRRDAADSEMTLWDTLMSGADLPSAKAPSLTVDGQKNALVYLQSLNIAVEVTGNVASTRYTMVFRNKTNRTLEGELTFPLPDGRSATYYALDIDGKMREAVPVEKATGTQVFEEIEQRRVDPGLLERVEGNNLRTRIYPLAPNGKRTVAIGYEEELTLEKNMLIYRLPMAYADSLEEFTVKATVWKSGEKPLVPKTGDGLNFDKAGEDYVASFAREKYRPSRALVFGLPAPAGIPQVTMQPAQGNYYFLASVAPQIEPRKKQWPDELAIIWDVSLSGAQRNLQRETAMLDIIFAEKKDVSANLYFLNNKLAKKGQFKVSGGKWDKLREALDSAVFDGGTDFSQIDLKNIKGKEILFFSDGISTLSDADFLRGGAANRPIHCVVSSPKADYSALKAIADETDGKFVNANELSAERLKNEMLYETLRFLGAEYEGALREVYPSMAMPVYGDFSVAGISDTGYAELTLCFGFGSKVEERVAVTLDAKNSAGQRNTYKIWAQKKIAELDLDYLTHRAELAELGRQFGIVTRNTSLIVLETAADYVRYGIQPPSAEPELVADYFRRGGVAVSNVVVADGGSAGSRSPSGFGVGIYEGSGDPRARVSQMGVLGIVSGQIKGKSVASADVFGKGGFATDIDAILSGVGGLKSGGDGGRKGVSGIGYGSGYGSGSGSIDDLLDGLMGGSGNLDLKKRGELRVSSPDYLKGGSLTGGRSRASVQRVVLQNMAAIRYAYNRRSRDVPNLAGKVMVKFSIDETGKVIFAQVVESTINDSELENTIVTRITNWNFDKIDKPGDVTEVVYPFVFADGGWNYIPKQSAPSPRITRPRTEAEPPIASRPRVEAVRQSRDGVTLAGAASAAANLKRWWNIDFTVPEKPKSKYPVPDEAGGVADMGAKDGPAAPDKDYLKQLTGKAADDYQTYLKLREGYAASPAYYFDMAHWFYSLGDKETALRVLTSIADLELENAPLYRLLGYRFKEYGEYALEKFVCKKVVQWRPMEPQSYRDYALALADNGEKQAALDSLCALLARPYSDNILNRSRGIEEVIVTEINRLISQNPDLNTSRVDRRLVINIPVDIRVVINWNMDNTNIDLYVIDPNGEECSWNSRQTRLGGRISADIRSGYGPEQFLLKKAAAGRYRVYVNYFSDTQFTAAGPSTIMAEVYTIYADNSERRSVMSLQMSSAKKKDGKVEVADFSF